MEARLFELIRDYQAHRKSLVGGVETTFRLSSIRAYAAELPYRYPEYVVDPHRLAAAVASARRAGEILPAETGHRDALLELRIDAG